MRTIDFSLTPSPALSQSNPHIPGQKLVVKVPKNKTPGDKFPVNVPLPSVKSSGKVENKFTKECIDALDRYSSLYDDFCQAEGMFRQIYGNIIAGFEYTKLILIQIFYSLNV